MKIKHLILIVIAIIAIVLLISKPQPVINTQDNTIDSLKAIIDSLENAEDSVRIEYRDSIVEIEKEINNLQTMPIDSIIAYVVNYYDTINIIKTTYDPQNIAIDSVSLLQWINTIGDYKKCVKTANMQHRLISLKDRRIEYLEDMFRFSDSLYIDAELRIETLHCHLDVANTKAKRRGVAALIGIGAATLLIFTPL